MADSMELHDCVRGRARSAVTISISIHSHKKNGLLMEEGRPQHQPKGGETKHHHPKEEDNEREVLPPLFFESMSNTSVSTNETKRNLKTKNPVHSTAKQGKAK